MSFDSEDKHREVGQEPERTAVRDVDALMRDSPLINRLSSDDLKGCEPLLAANRERFNQQLEGNGILPATRVTDSHASPQDVLTNPQASAQEKLRAITELGRSGVESVTLTDQDGTKRECRVELEQCGGKTLVHLFTQDQNGKERVILRGVESKDGTFSHETGKGGRAVSFTGTWWSKHMSASSLGAADESSSTQPRSGHEQLHRPNDPKLEGLSQHPPFNPDDTNTGSQREWNYYFDQLAGNAQYSGKHMEQLRGGSVYIQAGMSIDSDGAPDSTEIDPHGKSHTSLRHPDGSSVNAKEVPYFVLPLRQYQQFGIHKGDIAAVRYNGKVEFAVFADVGPPQNLGEGSMALAQALGINDSPTRGGVQHGVEYIIFPRSGDGTPGIPQLNRFKGSQLLSTHAQYLSGNLKV